MMEKQEEPTRYWAIPQWQFEQNVCSMSISISPEDYVAGE